MFIVQELLLMIIELKNNGAAPLPWFGKDYYVFIKRTYTGIQECQYPSEA